MPNIYDQAAADALTALFNQYGLGTLAPKIVEFLKAGMSEAAIVAALRETPEYGARFPGMQALRDAGYNAVDEGSYLQLEDSYHTQLQNAGLPPGFYDEPTDFVKFMKQRVDPSEVGQRAQAAVELANQVDPTQRQLLSSMYGVGTGDIAAYLLDPGRAMPILQKQLQAVQIANAASHAGVGGDFNAARFERLADNGVSAGAAGQGYGQIGQELANLDLIGKAFGEAGFSLAEAEDATFLNNSTAANKRKRLADREKNAFSGASGFDARVSGQRNPAGSF